MTNATTIYIEKDSLDWSAPSSNTTTYVNNYFSAYWIGKYYDIEWTGDYLTLYLWILLNFTHGQTSSTSE